MPTTSSSSDSYQTKKIITILLLIAGLIVAIAGIFGVIFMWIWMKWNIWIKLLISGFFVFLYILAPLLVLSYLFVLRPVQIVGTSMNPNFTEGQYYMTNILDEQEQIVRGDVVVFFPPGMKVTQYIQRVIALPNETVKIQDDAVYINGQVLDEATYTKTATKILPNSTMVEGEEITIPAGQYFLLGDNRDKSQDSRAFGPVTRNAIQSKIGPCYWKCWQ